MTDCTAAAADSPSPAAPLTPVDVEVDQALHYPHLLCVKRRSSGHVQVVAEQLEAIGRWLILQIVTETCTAAMGAAGGPDPAASAEGQLRAGTSGQGA